MYSVECSECMLEYTCKITSTCLRNQWVKNTQIPCSLLNTPRAWWSFQVSPSSYDHVILCEAYDQYIMILMHRRHISWHFDDCDIITFAWAAFYICLLLIIESARLQGQSIKRASVLICFCFFMHRLFCSTTSSIPIKIYSFETIITFINNGLGQIVKILLHRRQASIYPMYDLLKIWPGHARSMLLIMLSMVVPVFNREGFNNWLEADN